MDGTYYKFRQIMALAEQHPNDMELGEKVREFYWAQKKTQANPNQLKIQFPDEEIIEDTDIDKIARRAED